MTITLSNVRYIPTFIGNLFSIPTAMSNGAEIRFIDNKMEVRKKDVMFEFLPANTDNCGFLFCINAKRKIVNRETASMAKTQLNVAVILLIKTSARRLCLMKM